jgi:A/G-specific adenine glycosylase
LNWFRENRRELPWRSNRHPYCVWVSEIMLQQTRVAAVLGHYGRFLRSFPTLRALAESDLEAVLAAWSGLGYYRRARAMHECARRLVAEHHAQFPMTAEQLRKLPGIGRYTAAAIASIAFEQPQAVLDGNVERVLWRLLGKPLARPQAWSTAQQLLDRRRPGDFNQAMMELGATICLPGRPNCAACPLHRWCAWPATGASRDERRSPPAQPGLHPNEPTPGPPPSPSFGEGGDRTPGPPPSPSFGEDGDRTPGLPRALRRQRQLVCALVQSPQRVGAPVRRQNSVLLVRRPARASLMPGMFELPPARATEARGEVLLRVRHSITNTDYVVTVVRGLGRRATAKRACWVQVDTLPAIPLTGLARKILRHFAMM